MVSEALAGLSAFKSMLDIAKGLKDINDTAARNAAVIELQEKIFSAQMAQATLVEQVRELEVKVARMEAWETEKKRYQLTDFGSGTFAYLLKEGMSNGEPSHRICAACYQNGQKSILQYKSTDITKRDLFSCPACDTTFRFGVKVPHEPKINYGPRRGRTRI